MKTPSGMAFNRFMFFVSIICATAIGYVPQGSAQTTPDVIELRRQIQELQERVRVLEEEISARSKDDDSLPDVMPSKPSEIGKPSNNEVRDSSRQTSKSELPPPEQVQEMKW